jgi:hypothetical protein
MIDIQQKRIEWICECLEQPKSLESIITFIKQKIVLLKINEVIRNKGVSKRTIEGDIEKIRYGNFSFVNNFENKKKGDIVFDIPYDRKSNTYSFSPSSARPIFVSSSEDENVTLPFISGILEPYKEIPGIKKIIHSFAHVYDYNKKSISKKAIVTSTKRSADINRIQEGLTKKTTELLSIISKRKAITLLYSNVSILISTISNSKKFILFPYQVRIHDGLHYLIALDLIDQKVKNFRIDQIKSQIAILDVDDEENDAEEIEALNRYSDKFPYLRLQDDFFKYSFGVWCHNYPRKLYKITIAFYDWAGSYILMQPLHATQILESKTENEVVISILLNLQAEPQTPYNLEVISKELAFALGRFRQSCEVRNIEFEKEEEIRYYYL